MTWRGPLVVSHERGAVRLAAYTRLSFVLAALVGLLTLAACARQSQPRLNLPLPADRPTFIFFFTDG